VIVEKTMPEPEPQYRRAVMRPRPPIRDDFAAIVGAGWDLVCCECDAVLGRLFVPFSGGLILHGSTSHLDPRLVERERRETQTGKSLRRYGPPSRVYEKGKGQRAALTNRAGLSINGPIWLYCYSCNTGQAVEAERLADGG
jgi:hypothetical protein